MTVLDFQSVAAASAAHFVNPMVEGLLLTASTWLVLRLFGVRNSLLRFSVWFSMLIAVVSLPFALTTTSSSVSTTWPGHPLIFSTKWAAVLFIAWTVIASLLLIRLAVSLRHVRRLGREAREILSPDLIAVVREFKPGRKLRLCVSDQVRVPTAIGFFRPAVVLPAWVLDELPREELRVILLHELAHLRRWDDWTNLVQKFLKAIFFFHPAVWWIESRLVLEREMACDDMVLARTANPRAYAASLVSLAERIFADKMRLGRALALAQNALGRLRQTSARLAEILDTNRTRSDRGWWPAVGVLAGLTLAAFVAMPYAPEMVGFSNPPVASISSEMATSPVAKAEAIPKPLTETARKNLVPKKSRPQVLPASARWSQKPSPRPLVTRARYQARSSAEMLLVVETRETYESGQAVWTFCVWRIQPDDPAERNMEESIVLNSI